MLRHASMFALLLAACATTQPCPAPQTTTVQEAPAAPAAPSVPAPVPTQAAQVGALRIEGAPEPTQELRARLRQYLEARHAVLESLSSDGKTLLIKTRFAETAQLHLVRAPLGDRRQLTFEREPIAFAELSPSDENTLWYGRDVGGNEDWQIYRLDLKSGVSTLVTDGKSRNEGLIVEHAGKRIAYASNQRNGKDMDLYVSDGLDPKSAKRVLEVSGNYTPLDFSPDGKRLLARHYVSILVSDLYVIDLESGKAELITTGPKASYRTAFFDGTGKRVYVASDREGEMNELYEATLGEGLAKFVSLTRDIPWNVESAALSPDKRTIAFVVNEEGYSTLHLFDTQSKKHRPAKNVPKGVIAGLEYAGKSDVIGLSLARPTSSTDAYVYAPKRGELVRYTQSELGGLDESQLIDPELVRVKSFDDLSVPAFVYRPKGTGPFPVVIDIHGGPESQSRPSFHALAQYLAKESGIALIVPNVRGSDGYGKTYLALDNGKLRENSVKDIGAVLDFVAKDPGLDEANVAVTGGSYGGYMVLASLVHHGARLQGGIDMVGIANFVTFLENTRDYRRDLRRVEYGDESNADMRTFLAQISPLTRVNEIKGALFVAHGTNDPRVPVGEAQQIIQAVKSQGREVWSMIAANEGHGFQKKENRDRFLETSVLFFEKILKSPR